MCALETNKSINKENEELLKNGKNKKDSPQFTISGIRYIILGLATASASLTLACHIAFSVSVTCNVPPDSTVEQRKKIYMNDSSNSPILYFEPLKESLLFGSFSIGNVIMLPLLPLLQRISIRYQVFLGTLVSGILNIAFPFFYDNNDTLAFGAKFLHGVAAAPLVPLMGYIAAHWSPRKDVGLFIGILTCFPQFAVLFTMSTAGLTCKYAGWRPIFYLHGIATTITAVLWFIFFRDKPSEHPWIKSEEAKMIQEGKGGSVVENKTPYKKLLTSKSIWGILIAAIGMSNGMTPLIVYAPVIMNRALNATEMTISIYSLLSTLLQTVFKLLSGFLSDKMSSVPERTKLSVFNTMSHGIAGMLMFIASFTTAETENMQILLCIFVVAVQSLTGFNAAGYNKAAVVVAGAHSTFVMTLFGFLFHLAMIYEPFIVVQVAREHTWTQWRPLLLVHGLILFFSNVLFCVMCDGKRMEFSSKTTTLSDELLNKSEEKNEIILQENSKDAPLLDNDDEVYEEEDPVLEPILEDVEEVQFTFSPRSSIKRRSVRASRQGPRRGGSPPPPPTPYSGPSGGPRPSSPTPTPPRLALFHVGSIREK